MVSHRKLAATARPASLVRQQHAVARLEQPVGMMEIEAVVMSEARSAVDE
jgi:hypothetical protein